MNAVKLNQCAVSLENELNVLGVQFMGIVNKVGKMEDFVCKSRIIFSKEKSEMFSMFFRLQYSLQREFDGELGSVNYSMVERENYKIISIPTPSNIVIIGASADVNHMEVINRVKILVQDSVTEYATNSVA